MKKRKKFVIAFALLFVAFYCISLFKCEFLTAVHGDEFEGLETNTNMLEKSDYLKVLDYSDTDSTVYYVGPNRSYANILSFSRNGKTDQWVHVKWDTIWSKSGSADGFIWPYIR